MGLRRAVGRLAAASIAVVVSLVALEIAVRLSGHADHLYTEPAFEPAAHGNYWQYRPGFEGVLLGATHVRIGPLGSRLNGPETSPRQVRIAVFGDSATFGQAVDEERTFSARLEQSLRAAGVPAEVLNFGVQGHTLDMMVAHVADRLDDLHAAVAILAFLTDDLNSERADNHVDRFGYLTKNVFGHSSVLGDAARALLRRSHLVLLTKESLLRLRSADASPSPGGAGVAVAADDARLLAFRAALKRFDALAAGMHRVVICLDLVETPLTLRVRDIMATEFRDLDYVHAPPAFAAKALNAWRVPLDGHPNAAAHEVYARLLAPPVVAAVRSRPVVTNGEAATTARAQ